MAKKLYIRRSILVEAEQFNKFGTFPDGVKVDETSATGYALEQTKTKKDITPETINSEDSDLDDIVYKDKAEISNKSFIVQDGGGKSIISESDFKNEFIEVKI